MTNIRFSGLLVAIIGLALLASACGGDDETDSGDAGSPEPTAESTASADASPADAGNGSDATASPPADESPAGGGVILADLCSDDQPLNGAISVDDLVSYGLFSSTDVTFEGNSARSASTYETFGFICNIGESTDDGQNLLTIGVKSGSDIWDLAVEQGNVPAETIGDWEVIVDGVNWLSPLTMRTTDASGNQDSLYVLWSRADGTIPDAEMLAESMRSLADAITSKATVDIPRS